MDSSQFEVILGKDCPVLTPRQPYLSGLQLAGRCVVVIGGGAVVQRRLPRLIEAEARIHVIAPEVTPAIARMASKGQLRWSERSYADGDLAEAWYVLVATRDAQCNSAVSREAERRRIFCVRADKAEEATAWTPATGVVDGVLIGVLSGGDSHRSRTIRDLLVQTLKRVSRRAA